MAEFSSQRPNRRRRNSKEESPYFCSMCRDVFTDPVSIPCKHNFCNTCLTQHWNTTQLCCCPLCKEKFTKRPELKVNTTLREEAEHFKKKRGLDKAEVLCDACTGVKQKALKSCLKCDESFCESHLKSHYNLPGLEHKLIDPEEKVRMKKVQQMIQDRLKKIKEIQNSVDVRKRNTEKEKADSVEFFTALTESIERSQAELLEEMEEKQKAAEMEAEALIKDLEQEVTELKRTDTELEQLSHTEDHLHLLQVYPSLCSPPHTNTCTDLSINPLLRKALSDLQESFTKTLVLSEMKRIQQFAVDVTLDPETAHKELILSDDGKQVKHGNKKQNLPDNQNRFDKCVSVLGKEGFCSGRFYYEVQVRGKTKWDLGVARESINRKGQITLKPQDGFWTVWLRNENEYQACADPSVLLSLTEKPQKVGVFVDYEEGLVSFYDVEARSHIYSFTGQSFTEKLYPYFSPSFNDGGKNSAPLIISPIKH